MGVDVVLMDIDWLLVVVSGVILFFGFFGWYYCNFNEVFFYNDCFNFDFQIEGEGCNINGMVGIGSMQCMMIFFWWVLYKGFRYVDSCNVGIYEFVYLLDKFDGDIDGLFVQLME